MACIAIAVQFSWAAIVPQLSSIHFVLHVDHIVNSGSQHVCFVPKNVATIFKLSLSTC